MANQNKKTNVRKGKQGFQKTTPVADHPKQLRHAPATPGNLTSGVAPTTYIPHRTIMSTIREYGNKVKQSFKSPGWKQREQYHRERTARLGLK